MSKDDGKAILGVVILFLVLWALLANCGGGSQYYHSPGGGVEIDVDHHKRPKPAPGVKPKAPSYKAPSGTSKRR